MTAMGPQYGPPYRHKPYTHKDAEIDRLKAELASARGASAYHEKIYLEAIAELAKLRELCDSTEFHDLLTLVKHSSPLGSSLHHALVKYEERKAAGRGEGMVAKAGHTQTAIVSDYTLETVTKITDRGPIGGVR